MKLLVASNVLLLAIASCLLVVVFRVKSEGDAVRLSKVDYDILLSGTPICRTPSGIRPAQIEP